MMDLAAQYTGKNNGRLCPSYLVMQASGWVSKATLQRARDALLTASFVMLTRKGHPPRTVDWVAFTWWKLDWERSMDGHIDPSRFPYLNFVKLADADPNAEQRLAQKNAARPPDLARAARRSNATCPTFEGAKG